MPLSAGSRLGPYEIVGPLGAGGMGEVYRARDTRLERTVAVKILPSQVSADPLRKQRFEREAKTVSQLNHPNICVLHDVGSQDGVDYLVMECIEGETLAKRLENGPLPFEQALRIGAQIADALDAAHRNGVVHRDLKPGNVMLTATGAKLLDFGLAKPAVAAANLATLTQATQTTPATEEGAIVGTFQYMSPEQVEGKDLDGRSDIFSLGAMLYEMLTGEKAFQGKSQLSVASAVLEKEPESLSNLKPMTPLALEHTIRRCLAKDREERWQTARDVSLELKWVGESGTEATTGKVSSAGKWRGWAGWVFAAVAILALVGFSLTRNRTPLPAEITRYALQPPAQEKYLFGAYQEGPKVSPDGRRIAFVAQGDSASRIWVKSSEASAAQPIPGTEQASTVFWSPDSQEVGFVAYGKLKRINLQGGGARTICEFDGSPRGASWNRQDVILFGTTPGVVYRVSASGGTPQRATTLDSKRQDILHRWPFFLPDGDHFLYLASATVTNHESNAVFVGSLDGKENKLLFLVSSPVIYANGYLLYLANQELMARPFDLSTLDVTGTAVPIASDILTDQYFGAAAFSASENGVLVFQQGKPFTGYSLRVLDRLGREVASRNEPGMYFYPRLSPDGKRVAYHAPDLQSGTTEVNVWDLASGNHRRATFDTFYYRTVVWSPDGSQIAYIGYQVGTAAIYVKALNELTAETKLLDLSKPDRRLADMSISAPNLTQWTADGKYLLADVSIGESRKVQIDRIALEGGAPETLLDSGAESIASGQVSPDGRWLAFRAMDTGRSEVYITSYPKPAGRIQVSTNGGGSPRWRKDSKELFYMGWDQQMMAAELKEEAGFLQVVSEKPLFQTHALSSPRSSHYDAALGGDRFCFLSISGEETSSPLQVVVNWPAGLNK